ncbi:MAG: hypothetical protein ACREA2_11735 [Blastocatellia bacterium]
MSMLGCIHRNTQVVGNVGAGLDNLHSFTLPAGSLANDGDYVSVSYGGEFATNANSKRVQVTFGGQVVSNNTQAQNSGAWSYIITYVRVSSTTVRATGQFTWHFASVAGGFVNTLYGTVGGGLLTVADLNSNGMVMLIQGEGVADNDITQNLSVIELCQQ